MKLTRKQDFRWWRTIRFFSQEWNTLHAGLALLSFATLVSSATASGMRADNALLDLPIEELMKVEVTSASRRAQKLTDVPSAIFVITQDDIKRSGVTNIPDALRMAPGVQVERVGTDRWSVSIRGFNGRFANKLQVLMDGRSVYNPIMSGTMWDQQDTMIEDIDRIEVIRGPAATVWGINSVNGVINIITKKAAETQGTLLTAGGGNFEHGFVGARYGSKINEETPFRIYAKGFTRDSTTSLAGSSNNDEWHSARGGFRIDHARGIDQFTLQGDFFSNFIGDTIDPSKLSLPSLSPSGIRGSNEGGNIRFRWDRTLSERSSIMLQTYFDKLKHKAGSAIDFDTESFDIDFQHRLPLFNRHDVTWGANYRMYHTHVTETDLIRMNPPSRTNNVFSGFIRDEITLIPERLSLTLGTRLDRNDFTGLEIQPNARLMWTPNAENSVWAAISRAVRTPSRAEEDAFLKALQLTSIPGLSALPFPIQAAFTGQSGFKSEKLLAYELGYRRLLTPRASIDIAAFINDYSQLRDFSLGGITLGTGLPRHLVATVTTNNGASALTYGVEVAMDWKPTEKWRLQGSYSFIQLDVNSSNPLTRDFDASTAGAGKSNPNHQVSFRSNYDFSDKLQLNMWLRYTSSIPFYHIPDYVTMDSKLIYKPYRNTELFVVGQNLFSQFHQESVGDFVPSIPVQIPRGVYGGVQWRF